MHYSNDATISRHAIRKCDGYCTALRRCSLLHPGRNQVQRRPVVKLNFIDWERVIVILEKGQKCKISKHLYLAQYHHEAALNFFELCVEAVRLWFINTGLDFHIFTGLISTSTSPLAISFLRSLTAFEFLVSFSDIFADVMTKGTCGVVLQEGDGRTT